MTTSKTPIIKATAINLGRMVYTEEKIAIPPIEKKEVKIKPVVVEAKKGERFLF